MYPVKQCQPIRQDLVPTILHHTPAGTSSKNALFYRLAYSSEGFHQFDYGEVIEIFKIAEMPDQIKDGFEMLSFLHGSLDYCAFSARQPNLTNFRRDFETDNLSGLT